MKNLVLALVFTSTTLLGYAQSISRLHIAPKGSDKIQISWSGTQEDDILRYELQRSNNANSFNEVLATVFTADGLYQVIDSTPNTGYNYYRVRAICRNNTTVYSATSYTKFGQYTASREVYPTVTNTGIIYAAMPDKMKNESITVLGVNGQKVPAAIEAKGDKRTINFQGAPAGNYIVVITDENGERSTHRVSYRP